MISAMASEIRELRLARDTAYEAGKQACQPEVTRLNEIIERLSAPRSSDWVLPPFDSPKKLPVVGQIVEYEWRHQPGVVKVYVTRWPLESTADRIVRWRYVVAPTPSPHPVNPVIGEVAKLSDDLAKCRDQWSIMARACGNWRTWPCEAEGDHDHNDWKAAARAIVERDSLKTAIRELALKAGGGATNAPDWMIREMFALADKLEASANHAVKDAQASPNRSVGHPSHGDGAGANPAGGSCDKETQPVEREESKSEKMVKRINEYLLSGGMFNPEMANHTAVRDLLIECRDEPAKAKDTP
jgi:hypothetical protein